MDDVILFHGSRGGIQGDIQPKSRPRCDFGFGFYMGTNELQAKTLVASDANPYFYKLNVRLSELPDSRILRLRDLDWAYFVLYNRGKLDSVKGTAFYKKYQTMGQDKDFIIGPIADDNMSRVIKEFVNNQITDKALLESLRSIDYGVQYVAKTSLACSLIDKVYESQMQEEETIPLILKSAERRREGLDAAEQMIWEYRRNGRYFAEIIKAIELEHEVLMPVSMDGLSEKYHDTLHKLILCKYEALREDFLAERMCRMVDGNSKAKTKEMKNIVKRIVGEYKSLPNFSQLYKDFPNTKEGKAFITMMRKQS